MRPVFFILPLWLLGCAPKPLTMDEAMMAFEGIAPSHVFCGGIELWDYVTEMPEIAVCIQGSYIQKGSRLGDNDGVRYFTVFWDGPESVVVCIYNCKGLYLEIFVGRFDTELIRYIRTGWHLLILMGNDMTDHELKQWIDSAQVRKCPQIVW